MCVILFSFQPDTDTPLTLGANRDEFFARPTAPLQFWEDHQSILAGRDLQAGGTWLGITRTGRFAAITNVREPGVVVNDPLSRGELTKNFLSGTESPEQYLQNIVDQQDRYAGFNLLVGDFSGEHASLYYFSNRGDGIKPLPAGTYGLSNHLLDSPWPKVADGKEKLRTRLQEAGVDHTLIRQILENPEQAHDERLPSTGIDYEREKALSAMFITLPDYGTRASTVLTISLDQVEFCEQNYSPSVDGKPKCEGETRCFAFELDTAATMPSAIARAK
ncbi:MAG: NRDE family protein [Cellvibrionaceae bacterium]